MTDKALQRRPGFRFVAELPPRASIARLGDALIVAAPDAPPLIIRSGEPPRPLV